jgi:glutaminyl-peptide cyclotransferase
MGGAAQTELSTIEHLILLDLLGAPNPSIQSYFIDTSWLFDGLVGSESRLRDIGALDTNLQGSSNSFKSFFVPKQGHYFYSGISDDHLPFMTRGVSVLHVIANPFPRVWHELEVNPLTLSYAVCLLTPITLQDDASALDLPTMRRWNLILRVFVSEYLHLIPTPKMARSEDELVRMVLLRFGIVSHGK